MACGCADRMRSILKLDGYTLEGEYWVKEGRESFEDSRLEEDHFRVLIESMSEKLFGRRALNFTRRVTGGMNG